jgi:hypothetical protein
MMRVDDGQSPGEPSEPRKLRLIRGLGQKKQEPLVSRDAVARALIEAGADLLLRRISSDRAEEIERLVDEALHLFDLVEANRLLVPVLARKLDELEVLMSEAREQRQTRRRR